MKLGINDFLKINFFAVALILAGCATKNFKEGAFQKAQWETKAQIKNIKEDKTQNLSIDIYAIKNQRARFEITAMLGYQVASVVMSPSEISYLVYPQKVFYYGKNSVNAFRPLIDLPLNPMNLANIAFDEPVRGAGWKCVFSAGVLNECENIQRQIKVLWRDRKEGTKMVQLTGPQFEMQWLFNVPQTEVQFKDELFTLKQPQGFKAIQIN